MSSYLHHSVVTFFLAKMGGHDRVVECNRLDIPDEYLYEIKRTDHLPPLLIQLSDAYHYSLAEFVARPPEIQGGDFVVVARRKQV